MPVVIIIPVVKTIGSETDEDQHPETNERPKRAESSELLDKWVNLGAKARQWSPTLQLRAAGAQTKKRKEVLKDASLRPRQAQPSPSCIFPARTGADRWDRFPWNLRLAQ